MAQGLNEIEARWQAGFCKEGTETIRSLLSNAPGLANVPVSFSPGSGSPRMGGPLYVASVHLKNLGLVRALVEAGAELGNGELGAHWPSPRYEINEYLIESGVDINQLSCHGAHALLGAAGIDSFFLMLEHGLDPNAAWPYNGETLLHAQARHDDDRYLAQAYCLIGAGADVNARTLSGLGSEPIMDSGHFVRFGKETPLHFAARLGNISQVRLLLGSGADRNLKTVSRMAEPKRSTLWEGEVSTLIWPLRHFRRVVYEKNPP